MPDDFAMSERTGLGMASVMARKGASREVIGSALALDLPSGPEWRRGEELSAVGTGPGTWLVMQEDALGLFADSLAERLSGLASVSDQSSGYAVFALSGPGARRVLQRGASIDLDPSAFRPGSAVTTVIGHIGVIFWQVDDEPTFEVAVFRSLAGSFRHWLETAAKAL